MPIYVLIINNNNNNDFLCLLTNFSLIMILRFLIKSEVGLKLYKLQHYYNFFLIYLFIHKP